MKMSRGEEKVMRAIWYFEEKGEELVNLAKILEQINLTCETQWKSQTTSTYLIRLTQKRYLNMSREGREFCYRSLNNRKNYIECLFQDLSSFWFNRDTAALQAAINEWKGSNNRSEV